MRIIDCDSHFIIPEIFDYVEGDLRKNLPEYIVDPRSILVNIKYTSDPITNKMDDNPDNTHCELPGMINIPERLQDLKKMKVDYQMLTPQERAMRFNYSVEKNLAASMAHSYNLTVKKIVDQYPDKFFGAALLPMQDMDLALQELDWVIQNNFKIVYIDYTIYSHSTKHNMAWSTIDRMKEFYKICEENNIVVLIHFLMQHKIPHSPPEKLKLITNGNKMGWIEMFLYDLLSSDVFDQYPNLRMVVTEGAQKNMLKVLPTLKDAYNRDPSLFNGKKYFLDYVKENMFFTIDIEMKESFNLLLENFGSKKLLFSTDYPHVDPSGMNKWNDTNDLLNSNLPRDDLENIAFRNAEKLFRLV
jgi:hypothetical protein